MINAWKRHKVESIGVLIENLTNELDRLGFDEWKIEAKKGNQCIEVKQEIFTKTKKKTSKKKR